MNAPHQQQRGMALLIVLFIVALVSVLATEMGSRLQLQVQRPGYNCIEMLNHPLSLSLSNISNSSPRLTL